MLAQSQEKNGYEYPLIILSFIDRYKGLRMGFMRILRKGDEKKGFRTLIGFLFFGHMVAQPGHEAIEFRQFRLIQGRQHPAFTLFVNGQYMRLVEPGPFFGNVELASPPVFRVVFPG